MQEYLYMLSKTIYYKYNKKTTQITIKYNIKNPISPTGVTIKGKLTKAQYYTYAKNLINYVDKYNRIPNYLSTKLGKMQYQTAVYTLNKILYYSATHSGALASTVSVSIAKTHSLNKNLPKYETSQAKNSTTTSTTSGTTKTLSQSLIWSASTSIKNYVANNGKLPNYITISGYKYSMPEYLYLISKAINTRVGGSTGAITVKTGVKNPSSPSGATISKTFTKAQYNDMAKRVVSYINSYNKAPNYLSAKYGASNIQYQTVIYGLSCVGNYINTKKAVPSSLTIKVAKTHSMNKYLPIYSSSSSSTNSSSSNNSSNTNSTTNQTTSLTTTLLGSNDKGKVELIGVFGNVNSKIKIAYVIGQHPLESSAHNALYNAIISKTNNLNYCYYIYRINVTKDASDYTNGRMNGQLLAQEFVLPHILTQNYNLVIDVHSNRGTQNGGSYKETNFIFAPLNHTSSKQIAEDIINQISSLVYYYPDSQTSPPYLTQPLVNAGINTIIYETYMYEDSATTSSLISELINKIDNYSFANTGSSSTSIALSDIIDAASRVKSYVETNGVLPNYVTIGTTQYSMPNFLYLLSTAIKNMAAGSTSGVKPITVNAATNPSGATIAGTLSKANYVDVATRVSNYIATNNRAPNYADSALGYIQFQSLVYELSKVLNYANSNNGVLPNTLTINTSNPKTLNGGSSSSDSGSFTGALNEKNTLSESELAKYLQATTRAQSNNATIIALAASLTKNCNTELEKATAIFNYVRDNIKYIYYTGTVYKATGALDNKKGNCVDQTHLLIALCRAAGIAATYVHADCTFTESGRIGHVFAQILIGDTWVVADTTHSSNTLGTITNWNTNTYTLKGQGKSADISI